MSDTNAIIIGAGTAGLATAAHLKQVGIPNFILEQSDKVGATWRKHYDRLHLHTDKKNSQPPFAAMPKEYPRYPSRDQVVAYLEDYAEQSDLDIRFEQQVASARRIDGQWQVQAGSSLHIAPNLVVPCGYSCQPVRPEWPGMESFPGKIIHSSEYKNGSEFKGKNVLVVGFGNSGGEIAIDLYEHGAGSHVSVRSPVNVIPKEIAGIPFLSFAIPQNALPARLADAINAPIVRILIRDIKKYSLRKLPYGPVEQARRDKKIPLIDIGTIKLIRDGQIKVHPGIESFPGNRIRFEGGKEVEFEAVVLATGYRQKMNEFLQEPPVLDEEGTPLSTGKESSISGLFFCGFYVSPTGMLREAVIEAKKIGDLIKKRYNR